MIHRAAGLPPGYGAAAETAPGAPSPVRVIVAASVRLVRDGLAYTLGTATEVVAATADACATLREIARLEPELLLLDVSMEGALGLVQQMAPAAPVARVVAFAVDDAHDDELLAWAEAGVAGWVGRDASADDVVQAVLRAARGELLCSARTAALLSARLALLARQGRVAAPADHASQLTPREAEVGELLARGCSNKHIARMLGLRLATVKNHVHSILEKLEVRSRGEAGALLRGTHAGV